MSDKERYLRQINEIERRYEGVTLGKDRGYTTRSLGPTYNIGIKLYEELSRHPGPPKGDLGHIREIARELIEDARPEAFLLGYRLYAKLGKGKEKIPKLIEATERSAKEGYMGAGIGMVKIAIEQQFRRPGKRGGLEGRVGIFILVAIGGVALSVSSLTATGNAIGNLTTSGTGLLGIFLFIAGLLGLFFSLRR